MHVMGSPTYGPAGTAAGYVPVQQYGTRDPRAARWWYRRTTIPVYLRLCNSNGYYYGRSGFSFGTLQQQYHYRPVVTADGFFRIIMSSTTVQSYHQRAARVRGTVLYRYVACRGSMIIYTAVPAGP